MHIRIVQEGPEALGAYGDVPIAFRVDRRMRYVEREPGAWDAVEVRVPEPWVKDYDLDAGPPARLAARWDLSSWLILAALHGETRVGGALVAWNTPAVEMLEGRDDLAVLFDLRIRPPYRRKGLGGALLDYAAAWARQRGCGDLEVETQDVNVSACRFYAKQGFRLKSVQPRGYPELPVVTKLVWTRRLT